MMIVLMGVVYYERSLLGSAALQAFFLAAQFVGWRSWRSGEQKDLRKKSKFLSPRSRLGLLAALLLSWLIMGMLLARSGGVSAWLDAFCTAGSVIAQSLMVAGFRECWLLWITVDIGYVWMMSELHLFFYVSLYLVFCVLAWNGWREWTRDLEE